MNTKKKDAFKTSFYAWQWGIITYFKELENFKEKLDARNIVTSTAEMATATVARMYDVNYSMEDKMLFWENKSEADQIDMHKAVLQTTTILENNERAYEIN